MFIILFCYIELYGLQVRLHTLAYRFTYGITTYQPTSQKRNIMKERKGKTTNILQPVQWRHSVSTVWV